MPSSLVAQLPNKAAMSWEKIQIYDQKKQKWLNFIPKKFTLKAEDRYFFVKRSRGMICQDIAQNVLKCCYKSRKILFIFLCFPTALLASDYTEEKLTFSNKPTVSSYTSPENSPTQKGVPSYLKPVSKALKTVHPELIKNLMEEVKSSAVTTRTVAFLLLWGGSYQVGAARNVSKPHIDRLKHGFKSIAFFLPAYWLYHSYCKQYLLHEFEKVPNDLSSSFYDRYREGVRAAAVGQFTCHESDCQIKAWVPKLGHWEGTGTYMESPDGEKFVLTADHILNPKGFPEDVLFFVYFEKNCFPGDKNYAFIKDIKSLRKRTESNETPRVANICDGDLDMAVATLMEAPEGIRPATFTKKSINVLDAEYYTLGSYGVPIPPKNTNGKIVLDNSNRQKCIKRSIYEFFFPPGCKLLLLRSECKPHPSNRLDIPITQGDSGASLRSTYDGGVVGVVVKGSYNNGICGSFAISTESLEREILDTVAKFKEE